MHPLKPMKRVVITGSGVVSALGNTPSELFENLRAGKSAVVRNPDWMNLPCAPLSLNPDEVKSIPRTSRRSMGRLALYSVLAARSALKEARFTPESDVDPSRFGCVVGSTIGSSDAMDSAFRTLLLGAGAQDLSPMEFFKCASHTTAFNTANALHIRGAVYSPAAACASGLQALGLGFGLIRAGIQDAALCGGAEELHRLVSGCFELMLAVAGTEFDDATQSSRPFDARRSGLICGEGAGILLLEELEHAKARGATILAEIVGYATCACAASIAQSDAASILRCIRLVCEEAQLDADDIDYISAHATSTPQGDAAEAEAIRSFFANRVPVSSLKGNLGHTLGASGALESTVLLEMMKRSEILPTLNLTDPDADCSGIDHVTSLRTKPLNTVLKNCFAFGGINAGMIFRKFQE